MSRRRAARPARADSRRRGAPRPLPGVHRLRAGTAEILQDLDVPNGWLLVLDGVPSSYLDLDDPTHLEFAYLQWVGRLVDLVAEPGAALDVVHLGGGGCTLPRYVAATRAGSRQLVVELDDDVIALVGAEFAIRSGRGLRLRSGDARDVLTGRPVASADVVVRDAFAGAAVPAHLTTAEFVAEAVRVLRPGGLYVANLSDGPPLPWARAEAATALAAFAEVLLVAETPVLRGRRYGNLVLAASSRPLPELDLARLLARGAAPTRVVHGDALRRFAAGHRPFTDAGFDREPPRLPSPRSDGWGTDAHADAPPRRAPPARIE